MDAALFITPFWKMIIKMSKRKTGRKGEREKERERERERTKFEFTITIQSKTDV